MTTAETSGTYNGANLALLVDCDNVGLGEWDVEALMSWLGTRGRLVIRRAYGDWLKRPKLKERLHLAAMEVVDMPSDTNGKNRADIRMVVDAMEIAFTRDHIDTFVVVSGDSDFIPLFGKLRELGRRAVVIARRNSRSRFLSAACDELVYLEQINQGHPSAQEQLDQIHIVLRSIVEESNQRQQDLTFASLKRLLTLANDSFCHTRFGFKNFRELVQSYDAELAEQLVRRENQERSSAKRSNPDGPAVDGVKKASLQASKVPSAKPGSPSISDRHNCSGPISDEILDHLSWAVRFLMEVRRDHASLTAIQNTVNSLFPAFRLTNYGFSKGAGYRKLFAMMEMEGWCTLVKDKKKKVSFTIRFTRKFLGREIGLAMPSQYGLRLRRCGKAEPTPSKVTTLDRKDAGKVESREVVSIAPQDISVHCEGVVAAAETNNDDRQGIVETAVVAGPETESIEARPLPTGTCTKERVGQARILRFPLFQDDEAFDEQTEGSGNDWRDVPF